LLDRAGESLLDIRAAFTHIPRPMFFNVLINVLLAINVLVSLLIILIVLMQRPKSEGLGAAFGGGMTENLFGAQTSNVLANATRWLGGIFFLLTLILSILYARKSTEHSAIQEAAIKAAAAAAAAPSASVAPSVAPLMNGTAVLPAPSASVAPAASASPAGLSLGVTGTAPAVLGNTSLDSTTPTPAASPAAPAKTGSAH
jgi:preprotein translocase subunit SecG